MAGLWLATPRRPLHGGHSTIGSLSVIGEVHMPPIVRMTIGDIAMWVRQGPQAAWDIGTSQAVITGDEYGLHPFLHSPLRHEVRTVVDIGANIGAFT